VGGLGAPGDRYQAERVVMEWWKKAGAPPKKAWETGKEEHRRYVSYKEAYAINPEQARMKLVETYLVCRSIAETARRWNLWESGSQAGPLLGRGAFRASGPFPTSPFLSYPNPHPTSRPRSGKRENAQVTEGKSRPETPLSTPRLGAFPSRILPILG